ncbi:MAG: hypothetical protein AUJ12_07875 [Alphaproteobacteria bacterium CG1_02_46_17]|nr:MAG: hypothetical protein AUJ12_07875 [Alphaproteobacteria bacterium CG1_02_46_17]
MNLLGKIKRELYGRAVGYAAYAGICLSSLTASQHDLRVFYGGARAGYRGGPQVKVKLLQDIFPENRFDFNVLYLSSGALYLPTEIIKKIKAKGVKLVINQNGVFYPAWYPKDWQEENARMARALDLADHVFYQSEFCKKSADKFLGTTAKSFEILYNAVDTKNFVPPLNHPARENFRFLVTGHIGLSTYYRLTNALDALVIARQKGLKVELSFSGILPADLEQDFRRKISDRALDQYFILSGAYDRMSAPHVFASADAYLMTKHNDPCPNVVLEAMSCGLPILYSASGGVPELVGTDAGIGINVPETYEDQPVPSAEDLARGMEAIIANRDVYALAARARAVEKFDLSFWGQRHREIFSKLCSGAG